MNIKKYIPTVWWILTMSKSILQWSKNGQYSKKHTWGHVKNLVFSNTRYPKYPMILKMNRVRIGYWKIFRVRVGYRVPVAPWLWHLPVLGTAMKSKSVKKQWFPGKKRNTVIQNNVFFLRKFIQIWFHSRPLHFFEAKGICVWMWSHTKNGCWLMESNLMKSVPTSLKLATVLESSWYLNSIMVNWWLTHLLTFLGDFCAGFSPRETHQPTWSLHPAEMLFLFTSELLRLWKCYLAFMLFDTVQENSLKKESQDEHYLICCLCQEIFM